MTPMQAIQAGTAWAAECIGWKDRIGTVEKGKLADLIVVDSDPLAEIKVLTEPARIALVIKDGAIAANRIKPSR
jgi:imidazolonepropionase-like amidohydrolase